MAIYNGDNSSNVAIYQNIYERNTLNMLGGDDTAMGGALSDLIYGGDGNDYLLGDDGSDALYGGTGIDTLLGGDGGDYLVFDGAGLAYAGSGDDTVYAGGGGSTISLGEAGDDLLNAGSGSDRFDGGTGEDSVAYLASTAGVTIDLQAGRGSGGFAAGDTYVSVENASGSNAYDDTLIGNGAYNYLQGLAGNDIIRGGAGGDRLDGGSGSDVLDYRTSDAGVLIDLATGATFGGDAQGDEFIGFERIWGSNYDDTLSGDSGAEVLRGMGGNDILAGRSGNDRLEGLDGNDHLVGGLGADRLAGGTGADTFQFRSTAESRVAAAARDTISDFSTTDRDRIDLSGIDANSAAAGNQAFHFLGTRFFDGGAGALRYAADADGVTLIGDIDGDRRVDFAIDLTGITELHPRDLIL